MAMHRTNEVPLSDDFVTLSLEGGERRVVRKWWAAANAGGGSLLWYGQMSRFQESDFAMGDLVSRLGVRSEYPYLMNWPITSKDLGPYYSSIERKLLPLSSSYGNADASPKQGEHYVYEDRRYVSHFERVLVDTLSRNNIPSFVGHTCIGGRAWETKPCHPQTLEACDRATPLLSRRNWYRRIWDCIQRNPAVKVADNAYVTRLTHDATQITGLEYVARTPLGETFCKSINAKLVVLGCGPIETIRVLLNSNLPDPSCLIGRYLTFTTESTCYVKTTIPRSSCREDQLSGLFANVSTKAFYDTPCPGLLKGGKVSIYDAFSAESPWKHVRNIGLFADDLAVYLKYARKYYVLKLSLKGESIPSADKYITLGKLRNVYGERVPSISYSYHPHDLRLHRFSREVFMNIARICGASGIIAASSPSSGEVLSAHHHGGAIFGKDPACSVLNSSCEHHWIRNLFVVDASFMPTSGATNSSLTTMANSLRVSEALLDRL